MKNTENRQKPLLFEAVFVLKTQKIHCFLKKIIA